MDQTMAYQGRESQEIRLSSASKGKDECRENLSKEPDSSSTEPQSPPGDILRQRQRVSRKTRQEILDGYFPKSIGQAEPPDVQGRLVSVRAADAGTALKNPQELLEDCFQYSIPQIVWPDAQGPFKCIMVGDGGTGKTIYVKRKLTGEFEEKYEPTMGMHAYMLKVSTKQGSTQFLCVDTPGHEKPGTPRDLYYKGAHCAMIICDITAKQTQKDVSMWYNDVHRVCGGIPVVVCGNKVDLKKREAKTKKVTFHMKKKLQYYEISAKSGYNLDKPFHYLAEKLVGDVEGANCI